MLAAIARWLFWSHLALLTYLQSTGFSGAALSHMLPVSLPGQQASPGVLLGQPWNCGSTGRILKAWELAPGRPASFP